MRRSIVLTILTLMAIQALAKPGDITSTIEIPSPEAFTGWKSKSSWITHSQDVTSLPKIKVNCDNKTLVPTHPQQITKEYHQFFTGSYNAHKLSGKSPVCKIKSREANPRCLMADSLEAALISDIYRDYCGNLYRGYWEVSFVKSDETMGTLFAKGRWTYSDPKSQFENDTKEGPTYALEEKEFSFLTEIFPGDQKKMSENLERALKYTHDLDPRTLLFTEKN